MASEAQLALIIKGDVNDVVKKLNQVEKEAGGLGKTLGDVGKIASGFLAANVVAGGAQKILGFLGESVSLASDLNEVISKNRAVFGDNAAEMERWASKADKALGLSKRAALDATGSLGNMFDQLGFTGEATVSMSKDIVQLAADFGSFHNADISEVIDAQSAAFRGEYDSLQRFLPLINAATVEQEAMAITGAKNAKELTQQDKALATYRLMLKGAGEAMGDFSKTSDQNANAARIQEAAMENLQATIGTKLLPVQLAITKAKLAMVDLLVTKVIPVLEELYAKHWPAVQKAIDSVVKFIEKAWPSLEPVFEFVAKHVMTQIEGMIQQIQGIVKIVTGVIDLVSALAHGDWARAWDAFNQVLEGALDVIQGTFKRMFGAIPGLLWDITQEAVRLVMEGISKLPGLLLDMVVDMANAGASIGKAFANAYISALNHVIKAWNGLEFGMSDPTGILGKAGLPDKISIGTPDLPLIPQLARGGIVTRPTLALVGEAGPEAVVPLGAGGAGLRPTIIVNVHGSILSERDIVRIIRDEYRRGGFRGVA